MADARAKEGLARGRFWQCVVAASVLSLTPPAHAAERSAVTREADGILASLRVEESGVTVGWRFLHPPPDPISRIDATLNGRPLGAPREPVAAFPAPGQSAALLCLIDESDPARAEVVRVAEDAASGLASALPSRVTVAVDTFGGGQRVGTLPPHDTPHDVNDSQGDLTAALREAINAMGAKPATRRAVLVFSDGFARRPVPVDELSASAATQGVGVFFVIRPSMRLADIAALERLAVATGGGTIDPAADLPTALSNTILSGAELSFPFGEALRYVWERQALVSATLVYGSHRLELSTGAELPTAGLSQTVSTVWRHGTSRSLAFGAGALVVVLGIVAVRLRRRSHRSA